MDLVQEAIAVATKMAGAAAPIAPAAAVVAEPSANAQTKIDAAPDAEGPVDVTAEPTDKPVEPVTETVTEPEPAKEPDEAKKQSTAFARKFAALERRDKSLSQREAQAKAEVAAAKQAVEVARQEAAKANALVASFKEGDPIAAMEALGIDFTALSKRLLGEKPTTDDELGKLRKEVADFKKASEDKLRSMEEVKQTELMNLEAQRAQAFYQHQEAAFRQEIQKTIEAEPEKFELCLIHGSSDDIFDTVTEHYKQTGEILETAVAAELVEQYHLAQAEKMNKAKKLAKAVKVEPAKDTGPSKKPKVVTNSGATVAPNRDSRPLTEQERIQAAIRLIAKT